MTVTNLAEIFRAIERLHKLELYEDLVLFAELNLPNDLSKSFNFGGANDLENDQRGFIFSCLGDACINLGQPTRAIRNYNMALRYLLSLTHCKEKNRYQPVLNTAELHFRMHKALLENKQEEDALRCLESISHAEQTPKVMFAITRLINQLAKPPTQITRSQLGKRFVDPSLQRSAKHFKAIVREVPEAVHCRSVILSTGSLKFPSLAGSTKTQSSTDSVKLSAEMPFVTREAQLWARVRQMEAQKQFAEATKLLESSDIDQNLRLMLEQARLFRIAGNSQKALACYQQAHQLDYTNAEGMDAYAALLGTQSNVAQVQKELDNLAHKMLQSNPRRAETFTVYGWAARQSHRPAEAKQFAMRAEQLAQQFKGRQRAEALFLKAQLLFDSKRLQKDMETTIAEALHYDNLLTPAYALAIQQATTQKRFADAKRIAKRAFEFVGDRNQQICYLYAQALAEDNSGAGGTEAAVEILEKMIQDGTSASLEPLILLSRLYEKQQRFEKAIALLNQYKESCGDARIHRELGDLLSKTNRSKDACAEYEKALNTIAPDSETKDKVDRDIVGRIFAAQMINLMGGFRTPQCAVNAAFENDGAGSTGGGAIPAGRGGRGPPPVTRITRRTMTINQHEHLRRLRGLAAMGSGTSEVSSGGIGIGTRQMAIRGGGVARRHRTAATSSSSPSMISPIVLAPLHFDEDEEGEDNDDDEEEEGEDDDGEDQISDDQVSMDEDETGTNMDEGDADGSIERPRGSSVSLAQHLQQIQQHIQRVQSFLTASTSGTERTESVTTTTTTTSQQGTNAAEDSFETSTSSVQGGNGREDIMAELFSADEPVREISLLAEDTQMSIDDGADGSGILEDDNME